MIDLVLPNQSYKLTATRKFLMVHCNWEASVLESIFHYDSFCFFHFYSSENWTISTTHFYRKQQITEVIKNDNV